MGNDLSTPRPELGFKGLKPGDSWCLCANRWLEAYQNGSAPRVKLKSTHLKALEVIDLDSLNFESCFVPCQSISKIISFFFIV